MTLFDLLADWQAKWRKGITPEQARETVEKAAKTAVKNHLRRQKRRAAEEAARKAGLPKNDDTTLPRRPARPLRGPIAPRMPSPSEIVQDVMTGNHGLNVANSLFAFMKLLGDAAVWVGRMAAASAASSATIKSSAAEPNGTPCAPPIVFEEGEPGARPVGERRRDIIRSDSLHRTNNLADNFYEQVAGQMFDYRDRDGLRPSLNEPALDAFNSKFDCQLKQWLREAQDHPTFRMIQAKLRKIFSDEHQAEKERAKAAHREFPGIGRDRILYLLYEHVDELLPAVKEWERWNEEQIAVAQQNAVGPDADGGEDDGGRRQVLRPEWPEDLRP